MTQCGCCVATGQLFRVRCCLLFLRFLVNYLRMDLLLRVDDLCLLRPIPKCGVLPQCPRAKALTQNSSRPRLFRTGATLSSVAISHGINANVTRTGAVLLVHRALEGTDVAAVVLDELGVAVGRLIGMSGGVLFPQQL